ncbi:hypothetical protein IQ06DRAFT_152848 [Phaeosphaeriaceae sp. SRC1lsM3a]|nr:hypothetical protein IQ06DRAFT_152848 [Stagonospora sp. SRC1lsM3a]
MRKLSHIRHVECAIQSISALGEGIGYERFFDVQMMVAAGPDPLHIVQDALATAELQNTIESLNILSQSYEFPGPQTRRTELLRPFEYPNALHLSFAFEAKLVPDCRFKAPHLTSLHIVVDNVFYSNHDSSRVQDFFPALPTTLRHVTISSAPGTVEQGCLYYCICRIIEGNVALSTFTLRDMHVIHDISYEDDDWEYEGNSSIEMVIFEDVRYCLTDSVTLCEPNPVYHGCPIFAPLLRFANDSRIVMRTDRNPLK